MQAIWYCYCCTNQWRHTLPALHMSRSSKFWKMCKQGNRGNVPQSYLCSSSSILPLSEFLQFQELAEQDVNNATSTKRVLRKKKEDPGTREYEPDVQYRGLDRIDSSINEF